MIQEPVATAGRQRRPLASSQQHPTHHDEHVHPHVPDSSLAVGLDRRAVMRWGMVGLGAALLAACGSDDPTSPSGTTADTATTGATTTGATAPGGTEDRTTGPSSADNAEPLAGFDAFAESVQAFTSGDVWMVECNGMPSHQMMVGITSWQQQFPVPQPYYDTNAWQLPRAPEMSDEPVSAKTGLFRGAIALAVNGVPIFNALNNRGDDALLAGELDEFGGHCGRADDYHYHVAPLHLEEVVGSGKPIAYALDGFAIYGSVEPDGGPVEALDDYNGHVGSDGVYHYHGTETYINGGLVGVVSVSDQVDPQPTTPAFRPAGEPLRGATVTGFDDLGDGSYRLDYTIGGEVGSAEYTVTDSSVAFTFTSPAGAVTTETYAR